MALKLPFKITLFPMGGHHLIARDFEGPDKENDEVKDELAARKKRRIKSLENCLQVFKLSTPTKSGEDVENPVAESADSEKDTKDDCNNQCSTQVLASTTSREEELSRDASSSQHHRKHVSFNPLIRATTFTGVMSEKANFSRANSTYTGQDAMSPTPTMFAPTEHEFDPKDTKRVEEEQDEPSLSSRTPATLTTRAWNIFRSLLSPATISMFLAFPIALVTPLKGLFVSLENSPIPNAPDGHPPLYFIMDTANFLGAASIPLGLVCLGAALAKLKVPKSWNTLPLGAIGWMAIGKLVVSPILGVLIVNAFVKIGFIHEDDKVLRFITM